MDADIDFLDVSPDDTKLPLRKGQADQLADRLQGVLPDVSARLRGCACHLPFAVLADGSRKLRTSIKTKDGRKVLTVRFCRMRCCPFCQSRRAAMWRAKYNHKKDVLARDFPPAEYIWLLLGFTVRNPPTSDMRKMVDRMRQAFEQMVRRENKRWIFDGWFLSVEITHEKPKGWVTERKLKSGKCHPHFHVLIVVRRDKYCSSEFAPMYEGDCGPGAALSSMWRKYMKLDYNVQVDIKEIQPKVRRDGSELDAMTATIYEVAKYCVKMADLLNKDVLDDAIDSNRDTVPTFRFRPFEEHDFTVQFIRQMKGARFTSCGGVLKNPRYPFMVRDDADLVHSRDLEEAAIAEMAVGFEHYQWVPQRNVDKVLELDDGSFIEYSACEKAYYCREYRNGDEQ